MSALYKCIQMFCTSSNVSYAKRQPSYIAKDDNSRFQSILLADRITDIGSEMSV